VREIGRADDDHDVADAEHVRERPARGDREDVAEHRELSVGDDARVLEGSVRRRQPRRAPRRRARRHHTAVRGDRRGVGRGPDADDQRTRQMAVEPQEAERHRLARDLHDEAAQALTSLLVHLRLLERANTPEEAQSRVKELRVLTAQALEEVRRVSLDLRPTILDDLGLEPALAWRVDEFNKLDGMRATIDSQGLDQRLPSDIELAFYRVGQESLNNIVKHARASEVSLQLDCTNCDSKGDSSVVPRKITLTIKDNGRGFDINQTHSEGMGLEIMRERAESVDASLRIASRPHEGTRIEVVWNDTEKDNG